MLRKRIKLSLAPLSLVAAAAKYGAATLRIFGPPERWLSG
jgi:hypothetical protein